MRKNLSALALFAIVIASVFSCATRDKKVIPNYSYELSDAGMTRFPLDTSQSFYFRYIQYDSLRDRLYLFNNYTTTIYCYKYSTRTLENKIVLENEGPNGVGPTSRMGFYMNGDTAYLMSYKTSRVIKYVNGKVLGQVDLMPKKFEEEGLPEATVFNPVLYHDNTLEIISQSVDPREDNTKLTNLILLDTRTDSVKRVITRPELYNKGYWGLFNLYRVSHAINAEEGKDVFCFPVSPDLLVYDARSKELTGKVPVSSDYFENEDVRPIRGVSVKQGLNFLNNKKEKAQKHDLMTSHYGPLYYDEYRKVYYLFTNIGLTRAEYNDGDMRKKYPMQHSIIVLDGQFKKLTEYLVPRHSLFLGGILIAPEGLLIANSEAYAKDENSLPFTILKLNKK
jgi:hypothetical protein